MLNRVIEPALYLAIFSSDHLSILTVVPWCWTLRILQSGCCTLKQEPTWGTEEKNEADFVNKVTIVFEEAI